MDNMDRKSFTRTAKYENSCATTAQNQTHNNPNRPRIFLSFNCPIVRINVLEGQAFIQSTLVIWLPRRGDPNVKRIKSHTTHTHSLRYSKLHYTVLRLKDD